jgi:hypothetical protein
MGMATSQSAMGSRSSYSESDKGGATLQKEALAFGYIYIIIIILKNSCLLVACRKTR